MAGVEPPHRGAAAAGQAARRGGRPLSAPPTLALVAGLPGAGKSTHAKRLAPALGALRLCEDDWLHDLGIDLWDQDARGRLTQRFNALAAELLALGTSVVLESGFWHRAERDELRAAARAAGARVELHLCELPLDELWRRVSARNEAGGAGTAVITREHLVEWEPLFERPTPDELARFDPLSLSLPPG